MDICDLLSEDSKLEKSKKLYFPTDVLKWMKNNAKPGMALKLMQICKYFQHKEFPYFVIKNIFVDPNFCKYTTLNDQKFDSENLDITTTKKFWITE